MEGILLHVLYRGEKANDFASEMERSGLRAAVLAEDGCMQYDYYRPLAEEKLRAARGALARPRRARQALRGRADGKAQGAQGKLRPRNDR